LMRLGILLIAMLRLGSAPQDAIVRERYSRILGDKAAALAMSDDTLLKGLMMSHHARFVE
jgi:hypothetical protein